VAEPSTRGGRRLSRAAAALAAPVLVLIGLAVALGVGGSADRPAGDAVAGEPQRVSLPVSQGPVAHTPVATTPSAGPPRRIDIPALGVHAAVDPIRVVDRALTPPDDPQRIGWWSGGARPGDPTGSALLTGHTIHTGGGALDDLERLAPGDEITVTRERGQVAYVVGSVSILSTEEVARRYRELFDQSGPGRLVLVTCEDWDGTAFRSSVVVIAQPVTPTG
jgi:LPXTG-site transpeptidase (sortase) family protein